MTDNIKKEEDAINSAVVTDSESKNIDLGDRNDSGLIDNSKQKSKGKEKAAFFGAVVIILILVLSQVMKLFSDDSAEEVDKGSNKTEVNIVSRSNFSTKEDNPNDQAKFNFGSSITEEEQSFIDSPPTQLLGDNTAPKPPVYQAEVIPPLNKAVRGGFMVNKRGGNPDFSNPTDSGNPEDLIGGKNDIFDAPAFAPEAARKSPYNPHLLLAQGTTIPCNLRGRLVSNVGGQVSCIISDDVLSSSGAVVLIEKGSVINGFYRGNEVQRGHNQIFVVWQETRTPNNLIIPLNSGSTDPLGANGLSGYVDNHFWERFGNAMVLSLFNDVTAAAAQNLTKDGKQDYTENTRSETNSIATEILKRSMDIEPTLYKNQGDKINVFVARDIDFSKVYSLRRR